MKKFISIIAACVGASLLTIAGAGIAGADPHQCANPDAPEGATAWRTGPGNKQNLYICHYFPTADAGGLQSHWVLADR